MRPTEKKQIEYRPLTSNTYRAISGKKTLLKSRLSRTVAWWLRALIVAKGPGSVPSIHISPEVEGLSIRGLPAQFNEALSQNQKLQKGCDYSSEVDQLSVVGVSVSTTINKVQSLTGHWFFLLLQ